MTNTKLPGWLKDKRFYLGGRTNPGRVNKPSEEDERRRLARQQVEAARDERELERSLAEVWE